MDVLGVVVVLGISVVDNMRKEIVGTKVKLTGEVFKTNKNKNATVTNIERLPDGRWGFWYKCEDKETGLELFHTIKGLKENVVRLN